jgi:Na+-driven multidrug efflux pump
MSDLWTSATGVFLNGSVLGVFVGKAMMAGEHGFAGEWLQVSLVIVGVMSLIVAGAWACTDGVLEQFFGVNKDIAHKAQYYSLVFAIAIPARVVLNDLTQYYREQKYSAPSVIAGLIATIVNLIVSIVVVLGEPSDWFNGGFGFIAAPIVPVAATYLQLLILFLISPKMEMWPGW